MPIQGFTVDEQVKQKVKIGFYIAIIHFNLIIYFT